MAGVTDAAQARTFINYLLGCCSEFKGKAPLLPLSNKSPNFKQSLNEGDFWHEGIRLALIYMCVKALEQYGYKADARNFAIETLKVQHLIHKKLAKDTIWRENKESDYHVAEEFYTCSALGPISLFIENILGFSKVSGATGEVHWDFTPSNSPYGIENLSFGEYRVSIVYDGKQYVNTESNYDFDIILNGVRFEMEKGKDRFIPNKVGKERRSSAKNKSKRNSKSKTRSKSSKNR